MPLALNDNCLVDSLTVSRFVFGVDDITQDPDMSSQDKYAIALAVNAASAQVQKYCDYQFIQEDYVEVWDSPESDQLLPRELPINSVASIIRALDGNFDGVTPIDPELYYTDGRIVFFRYGYGMERARGAMQVTYNAGYEEIPQDLQLACMMQFQYLNKQIGKGDSLLGLKSASKMNENVTMDDAIGKTGLISEVEGMLRPHVRLEVPHSIRFARAQ